MLRSIAALAGASAVAAHGGMTTPLPRNSFNQPLDPSQPAVFGDMTNYYDVSVALPGPRGHVLPPFAQMYVGLRATSLNAVRAQDGCMPGCDECQHHGVMDGTDVGPYGKETHTTNIWAAPSNVQCKVNGKLVGPGVYNITLPGADTLPNYARTWNRDGDKVNANPLIGDWGRFQPWRAPGASKILNPCGLLCDHCHDSDDPSRPTLTNGTDLPPLKSPPTKWTAGGVAEVGWGLAVNHGASARPRAPTPTRMSLIARAATRQAEATSTGCARRAPR